MHKNIYWTFLILIVIYLIGFGIDIMDVDAAQYASMSREMLQRGDYLHLYDLGKDYLDKPPFLIWISALSMKIFGINNFAYRFPSFLFSILSLYSTYKFCRLYYNTRISILAAIILGSSQAFFLMNHDVRTDSILMGWVIFSLWQFGAWYRSNKFYHLIATCIGIAGGMMTKGPVALLVPVFAFGSHFILQRNFKAFFRWQYLAIIIITGIILLPVCIGLYQQFDMNPEKVVNGKTGVSGLRFFFWTQSFGRITGESDWNNKSNIFFLIQNMLWSFLPWILFFIIAMVLDIRIIIQQKFRILQNQEAITTGGFLLTYLSLGLSKYQLPHYIFIVFPLAAIITARFMHALIFEKKYPKVQVILFNIHFIIFTLLWLALLVLMVACFDTIPVYIPAMTAILLVLFVFIFFFNRKSTLILPIICLYTIMGINLFLNVSLYPSLLKYQMGNVAGRWIHENKIPVDQIFIYRYSELRSLHFYAQANIAHKDSIILLRKGDWVITGETHLKDLDMGGIKYDINFKGKDFHVSRLSLKFLNPRKREKVLLPYVIIKIK